MRGPATDAATTSSHGVAASPKVAVVARRVDDEVLVELVPDVDDLAQERHGDAGRPQHAATGCC